MRQIKASAKENKQTKDDVLEIGSVLLDLDYNRQSKKTWMKWLLAWDRAQHFGDAKEPLITSVRKLLWAHLGDWQKKQKKSADDDGGDDDDDERKSKEKVEEHQQDPNKVQVKKEEAQEELGKSNTMETSGSRSLISEDSTTDGRVFRSVKDLNHGKMYLLTMMNTSICR